MPPPDLPIVHWTELERAEPHRYSGDDELMGHEASYRRRFGFERLGIHHLRLPPGRRSSYPHAESVEEEFVFVVEGTPDVWLDGRLTRLKPGDAVGFTPGTGLCHAFLNNTDADVRLIVVGDTDKRENRIYYPRDPERQPLRPDWWQDWPQRELGDHDGLTDARRAQKAKG
jgi:uncharacterized cupin superfamily protein